MKSGEDLYLGPKLPKSSSALAAAHEAGDLSITHRNQQCPNYVREHDHFMPIANIIRIMRTVLPPHAKIADDAKETVQQCVSEFIGFVTGEANDRCHREQRKTITAEDILWAMANLGFENYIEPLTLFLNRYRETETKRTSLHGQPFVKRPINFGPENYGSHALTLGRAHENSGQAHENSDAHADMMNGMNSSYNYYYYRDDSGEGSSSSGQVALPGFDPYLQFKRFNDYKDSDKK
ncbi:hypothetical protein U1Q18_000279 [Sarracenia purpurea var. burkii]